MNFQTRRSSDNPSINPVTLWAGQDPLRQKEIEYLSDHDLQKDTSVDIEGNLRMPFAIRDWQFLLVLKNTFPHRTKDGGYPIAVYMVYPQTQEILDQYPYMTPSPYTEKLMSYIHQDAEGLFYLSFPSYGDILADHKAGKRVKITFCQHTLSTMKNWTETLQSELKRISRKTQGTSAQTVQQIRKPVPAEQPMPRTSQNTRPDTPARQNRDRNRSKYTDGQSARGTVNPLCKAVVLSDRAYNQIYSETYARVRTETGGLLLGHFENGIWYVVEATDPGARATFTSTYHEGDAEYENHVSRVISRLYKHPLVFLGMWHRHPGSLDTFSSTDDITNYKYAGSAGNGCISALVNLDRDFRLTFYYVEQVPRERDVRYTKVDIKIGDIYFTNPNILRLAQIRPEATSEPITLAPDEIRPLSEAEYENQENLRREKRGQDKTAEKLLRKKRP